ncbi:MULTISPECIES: AAA family ATPase [unclassified Amycolatopsis]|uniref:AAA family ATPase n=1 Tax=unclassified Amycolatopsis TaxID=2618356 RepID=UPI001C6966AB|nr:AAA family ATPase [Amycolatopsis sp. DSM 110486]QYN20381.1 AAA family ATPase [Amycolatopsis sp. DSM 110486]
MVTWEKPDRDSALQTDTIDVLNTELGRLSPEQRDLFDRERNVTAGRLGAGSATRTAVLLDAAGDGLAPAVPYAPPEPIEDAVRGFVTSSARVFLVTGAAGTGKTTFIEYLARQFGPSIDCQLLTLASWELATVDVAAEILRYTSIPRGDDALLSLESHSAQLTRPFLVVIDGTATHEAFAAIGRQVDAILRQVTTSALRFVLTVRSPPAIETTAHPLLHASLFKENHGGEHAGYHTIQPWTTAQARARWDRAADVPFSGLPAGVQHLIRTPLYMTLALDAPPDATRGDLSTYALIDHCVRRVLGNDTDAVEQRIALLTHLAQHQSEDEVPPTLAGLTSAAVTTAPELPLRMPATVIRRTHSGKREFTHDVLCEFFLSTSLADRLHEQGRSVNTVRALNELADRAATSGTARSIYDLVLQRLDAVAPEILDFVATAPTASLVSTVPLMMTGAERTRFATSEVLRACADRAATSQDPALSRALLRNPNTHNALARTSYRWLLTLLRRFGTEIWPDIGTFVETTFNSVDAYTLLDSTNLADSGEATFFARHFYLFFGDAGDTTLETFLSHPDWRVRAALAEALSDETVAVDETGLTVMSRLIADADYKVRATVAPVVTRAPGDAAIHFLTILLEDNNWHVRDRALRGLDRLGIPPRRKELIDCALSIMDTSATWRNAPGNVEPTQDRLRILYSGEPPHEIAELRRRRGDHRALRTILREVRTGHLNPPFHSDRARHAQHRRRSHRRSCCGQRGGRPDRSWRSSDQGSRRRSDFACGGSVRGQGEVHRRATFHRCRRLRGQRATGRCVFPARRACSSPLMQGQTSFSSLVLRPPPAFEQQLMPGVGLRSRSCSTLLSTPRIDGSRIWNVPA